MSELDIVEPNSTAVQRFLRRDGLARYESPTLATLLTLFDDQADGFAFHDVGANMGLYALVCAAMFAPASVDAFEPTPTTAAVLRRIVRANRLDVNVVEAAVGDRTGTAMLHLSAKSDASNSLVSGFKESHSSVEVPTISLDDHVRRTGHDPNIVKIDVETFEPQVLAGASDMIRRSRPYIVIEVLNRGGRDHGEEITQAMAEHGYFHYPLVESPEWKSLDVVQGLVSTPHHDWLLAPRPVDDAFLERWTVWRERLTHCSVERNSRVPILLSARAALSRGGPGEVVAAARRYLAEVRRR
jgi:FkbM family methyltransferase